MIWTDRRLRGALVGILATIAMSLVMIAGMVSGLAPMPEPIPKALVTLVLGATAPQPVLMGAAILTHLGYGAFWGGLLYGLHEGPRMREGIGLGVGLWILMGVAFLPLLGWGLFGTGLDPRIAVATLVLHVVYGLALVPSFDALTPSARPEEPSGAPGA